MIYQTGDWHLFHDNVLKPDYDNRPFKDMEEMVEALVWNHNSVVSENDICYFNGDITFGGSGRTRTVLNRLNGKKILVRGNHEDGGKQSQLNKGFDEVVDGWWKELEYGGLRFVLSHCPPLDERYPQYSPPLELNPDYYIHAHVHHGWYVKGNFINCGVMWHKYKPVSMEQIMKIVEKLNGIKKD